MEGSYTVKTEAFEGPLDLLLELVTKRKLFVSDVSLAQVADDFVRYVEAQGEVPISESAEFILVASTLMLVKSRSLLPMLQLSEEEEESIHDLENRLAVYARVKELAAHLRDIYGTHVIFEKELRKNDLVIFSPDSKTDIENLHNALERLIMALPKKEVLPKVLVKKVISLEEMIEKLSERIAKAGRMRFGDFKHKDKISVIVGFLAMLELVKRGAIRVSQEDAAGQPHGEIEIERHSDSVGIPTYA
ncbi:segregation/condensation protein A [Candidatus Parcubacteria bacterium]|nr:segregation/condensation protein A [Candidatus Parcubacteria bacterium]